MQVCKTLGLIILVLLLGSSASYAEVVKQKLDPKKAAQIRAEIKQLVDDYAILRDNQDAVGYANLFIEDGTLVLYGKTRKGRAALQKSVEDSNPNVVTMHNMSSGNISIIDETTANGIHYMTLYKGIKSDDYKEGETINLSKFTVMGKYHDQYVLTDEGWKFSKRRIEAIFRPEK